MKSLLIVVVFALTVLTYGKYEQYQAFKEEKCQDPTNTTYIRALNLCDSNEYGTYSSVTTKGDSIYFLTCYDDACENCNSVGVYIDACHEHSGKEDRKSVMYSIVSFIPNTPKAAYQVSYTTTKTSCTNQETDLSWIIITEGACKPEACAYDNTTLAYTQTFCGVPPFVNQTSM